jgi:hypothetical protein
LGSCIFLFVKHPYDVGDRVDITGPEKEQLIVERISLLYTIFVRIDRMQVVQVPNIVLNNLWIENVSRSKAMKEVIDVNVSYDTSFEDIELLRLEMEKFVRHPDNARDFQSDLAIGVASVGDLDKLCLKIAMKHKSNWHNEAVRATRRSKFMCALALALKKIPIYAPGGGGEVLGGPTNPSYSVAVSDDVAAAARDKAAKDKEAKRIFIPPVMRSSSTITKSGTKESEKQAAAELNTRNPALEAADGWAMTVDDNTLNSRDDSLERKLSIEAVRQELIGKRESQRGRRQAGQGLPPSAYGESGTPTVQMQQYQSQQRSGTFDIESQTGRPAGFGQSPYGNMTTTTAGATAAAHQGGGGYSVFPPPRSSPPGSSSGPPHPLQSAPTLPGQSTTRPRGASQSRPPLGTIPSQGGRPGQI